MNARATREYWDAKLEYNALRTGSKDTDAGAFLSWQIEAAGDILRELGKTPSDMSYIDQKIGRIERELSSRDWVESLSPGEKERLNQVKQDLEGLPADTPITQAMKELVYSITKRDLRSIWQQLKNLKALLSTNPTPQMGTCYEDAWRFLIKEEEGELVHGSVLTIGGRINHAWVELSTGFVWEPESGEFMKKSNFYERAKPQVHARYTAEEAAIMVTRVGKHGPWTDEERAQWLHKEKQLAEVIARYIVSQRKPHIKAVVLDSIFRELGYGAEEVESFTSYLLTPEGKAFFRTTIRIELLRAGYSPKEGDYE